MTDPLHTHPCFDHFMESRQGTDEPSDFEIFLLNAILALPPPGVHTPGTPATPATPLIEFPFRPTSSIHSKEVKLSQTPFIGQQAGSTKTSTGTSLASDKLYPTALLKCPLHVFNAFCKEYKLGPVLVLELHHARRRKKNRMFQRITRKRRMHGIDGTKQRDDYESDDEGKCDEIDFARVYAELMAGLSLHAKE